MCAWHCISNIKLELCAFALKGEHNVYFLVPNIHVPVCLYIDQRWIYIKLHSASSRFDSNHSFNFHWKCFFDMAVGSHFGCPKITSYHFRSIPSFLLLWIFYKMAAGSHFGCPKLTFDGICGHFRSIRNFFIKTSIQNGRRSPFCQMSMKITFDHISGHFRLIRNLLIWFWNFY